MSQADDTKRLMAILLESDAEGWSRLQGLMAILALPLVAAGARKVEIEVSPGVWASITSCAFDSEMLTFWCGKHITVAYEFRHGEQVPRWRMHGEQEVVSGEVG